MTIRAYFFIAFGHGEHQPKSLYSGSASFSILSVILHTVLLHLPTALMSNLFRVSFAEVVPLGPVLGKLGLILAWSIPFYAAVVWRIRRSDR